VRHGIGEAIWTTKLIDSFIYLDHEQKNRNINVSTKRIGTMNSYNSKQTVKHGVGKAIWTTKLIDSFIYLDHEQKNRGVFTSTFYTTEDTSE
jgi:hypothetical protein